MVDLALSPFVPWGLGAGELSGRSVLRSVGIVGPRDCGAGRSLGQNGRGACGPWF